MLSKLDAEKSTRVQILQAAMLNSHVHAFDIRRQGDGCRFKAERRRIKVERGWLKGDGCDTGDGCGDGCDTCDTKKSTALAEEVLGSFMQGFGHHVDLSGKEDGFAAQLATQIHKLTGKEPRWENDVIREQ